MPDSLTPALTVPEQLRQLIAKHGAAIVNDRARCRGLIRDYCTADRRDANLVLAALEDGVPGELSETAPASIAMRFASLRTRLQTDHGMTPAAAGSAIASWYFALGLGNESSMKSLMTATDGKGAAIVPQPRPSRVVRYGGWVLAALFAAGCAILYSRSLDIQAEADTNDRNLTSVLEQAATTDRQLKSAQQTLASLQAEVTKKKDLPDENFATVTWPMQTLHSPAGALQDSLKFTLSMNGRTGQASGTETGILGIDFNFAWTLRLATVGKNLLTGVEHYAIEALLKGGDTVVRTIDVDTVGPDPAHIRYHVARVCPGPADPHFDTPTLNCLAP